MKKLYTILLLIVSACNAKAQTSDKKISLMIKGGINLANYSAPESRVLVIENMEFKNLVSYNFSALANAKITSKLALQFGLGISQKGTIISSSIEYTDENGLSMGYKEDNFTYRVTYLEMPLNLIYSYKKLNLGAGPYLGYAVAAKSIWPPGYLTFYKQPNFQNKRDLPIGNDYNAIVKPLDFGVNFLANYAIKYGLNIGVNYGLGLTKAIEDPVVVKGKNRVFSVLVGYSF